VIGTGRNTARITPRGGVTYLDLDVSSDESVAGAVQQVIERFGRLDVLVNNAGIGSAPTQPIGGQSHGETQDRGATGYTRAASAPGTARTRRGESPQRRPVNRQRSPAPKPT
jgi:NAD(P)-dependent dehydrogenase (short-subunit alcohol dehydrogenase family)